ncbi:JAB domain-containing protein [Olleya sp. 1-3]|uniref:JAB domain-containing protein n=1 Tax=Olleya sp. 1-3 TaxID=2058323 RepID=UPI000C32A726|nr:JAB domain-containing protein [Olleya sp. 1-3]PKG52930.1 DNA repair protein [Olleya sp. 1-3]
MKASEIKISYLNDKLEKVLIPNSQTIYNLIKIHCNLSNIEIHEEVKVVLLSKANILIGICDLPKDSIMNCSINIKLLLSVVLRAKSSNIILVHNHISRNINPTDVDKRITTALKNACDMVDIKLLDHLIISKESYFSFKDGSFL